jgi:deoxyguanosine kinase
MYIVIEGPIGCGKTSLTDLLGVAHNYRCAHEIVEENPFLEKFYVDQER